jgi:NMD protein affecting ribosome stability and mRNA decay
MSITATRPRGASLRGDHYLCGRCGHEAKFNRSRGRPAMCRDCYEVETATTPTETGPST